MRHGGRRVLGSLLVFTAALAPHVRAAEAAAPPPPLPPEVWAVDVAPPPLPPPKLWCGGAEFGVSGADGNSENSKLHVAANAKRATPEDVFTCDVLYSYATSGSQPTENRLIANDRNEWLFPNSPWNLFTSGSAEYDQFEDFDVRLAGHAGLGYRFLKTDWSCLKGRLGLGGSQKIGGPDERPVPEGLVGCDLEQKITERQRVTSSVEYFPDLVRADGYRMVGKLTYDILVDPALKMNVRLGLLDRYDNNSGKAKPNDLEYFAVLLFKF